MTFSALIEQSMCGINACSGFYRSAQQGYTSPRAPDRGRATEVKGFCKIGFKRLAFIQAISRLLKLGAARTSFRADKLSATNDSQLPAKKKPNKKTDIFMQKS